MWFEIHPRRCTSRWDYSVFKDDNMVLARHIFSGIYHDDISFAYSYKKTYLKNLTDIPHGCKALMPLDAIDFPIVMKLNDFFR